MHLLDNVCLIESEVLAPPTASTFEWSITKLASYEHSNSWTKLCIVHGSMIGSHHWKRNDGKIVNFFGACFSQGRGQESEPVSVEYRSVEYSLSHAVGYPKIGW